MAESNAAEVDNVSITIRELGGKVRKARRYSTPWYAYNAYVRWL